MVRHISCLCGLSGLINVNLEYQRGLFWQCLVNMHRDETVAKRVKTGEGEDKIDQIKIETSGG